MKLIDAIVSEFEHEAQTTRRHLERLPDDRLDWRPHEKSFTARGLSSHIVECVGWTASIFSSDEFDFAPATYKPYLASSVADLLKSFDEKVAEGTRVLAGATDKDLVRPWRLKVMGRVRVEKPKGGGVQGFHVESRDSPPRAAVGLPAVARCAGPGFIRTDGRRARLNCGRLIPAHHSARRLLP